MSLSFENESSTKLVVDPWDDLPRPVPQENTLVSDLLRMLDDPIVQIEHDSPPTEPSDKIASPRPLGIPARTPENLHELAREQMSFEDKCFAAVKDDWRALEFIRYQNVQMCCLAVTQSRHALKFVRQQTFKVCLAAVLADGLALEFCHRQNWDLVMAAVKQNPRALAFSWHQPEEICRAAVEKNWRALRLVKDLTSPAGLRLSLLALRQSPEAAAIIWPNERRH